MQLLKRIYHCIQPKNITYCNIVTVEPTNLLCDCNIIITGGASGIGKAIAKKAVLEGATVLIIGRSEEKLKHAVKDIGDNCKYVVMDVCEDSLISKCEKYFSGKITNIVNNAGVYIHHDGDYSIDEFEQTIRTNLQAPFFITQEYVDYCRLHHIKGNVLMIASNRGLIGDISPYGASKAGLINCVQGFARECISDGIRVNAICPGMTASEINGISKHDNLFQEGPRGKRVLLSEEIAEIACFLMCQVSGCINGALIPCDEGDYLR